MKPILHENVLRSDLEGVADAIAKGCDLNELDELGNSPIHWAVMRGDIDTVKLLLEAKANPNILCSDGYTPKWSAVDFGLTDIEELLTSFGGKVLTDQNFDRTSWSVFKDFMGEPLPEEEDKSKKGLFGRFLKLISRFKKK